MIYEAMADRHSTQVVAGHPHTQAVECQLRIGHCLRYPCLETAREALVVPMLVGRANRGRRWVLWRDQLALPHIAQQCQSGCSRRHVSETRQDL